MVVATGALADPVVSHLPGVDRFGGAVFHSARWDRSVELTGKRVAVIGTGASSIQFVPAIQPQVTSAPPLRNGALRRAVLTSPTMKPGMTRTGPECRGGPGHFVGSLCGIASTTSLTTEPRRRRRHRAARWG
jgi:hypothetical protein